MSNFLLIVPEGYTEIPNAAEFFLSHLSPEEISRNMAEGSVWEIAGALDNAGHLPAGMMVEDAKIFDDNTGARLYVKFIPEQ